MNVEEQTRSGLAWLTEDVVGGPDLATAVRDGRRRLRRRRATTGAVAAAAVVALGAGAAYQLAPGARPVAVDRGPSSSGPSYRDFVPGTQVDEALQATVAAHLSPLPEAGDVYPSDWNTDGPLPDGQAKNATVWQAVYHLDGGQRVTVLMSKKIPGGVDGPYCSPLGAQHDSAQPRCSTVHTAGGVVVSDAYSETAAGAPAFVFETTFTRPDGSQAVALDRVRAPSWHDAKAQVAFTRDELQQLVVDPALDFPDPVDPPPPPLSLN